MDHPDDAPINWHEQWALFAPNFRDGYAHIEVGNKSFKLAPGAGFGDLSHPTTALVLKLMQRFVLDRVVLDLGSGSGILSLAAIALGAKESIGIDIDPDAIQHARENARLNGLENRCKFGTVDMFDRCSYKPDLLLMNMIRSEQREAYNSLPDSVRAFSLAITSGILKEEKKRYQELVAEWGFQIQTCRESRGWLAFLLKRL